MKMGYVLAEYAALAPAVHQITTIICFSYAYEKNNVPHNNITTIAKTITMGILRMNMKGKALLAGCIALAFSTMAQAEIKVAVVGAMSGPVAQYGDQEFTGAEQAVADINAKVSARAWISETGIFSVEMRKCSSERWVCAPHSSS
jgi:branched-chain amino acid transport system substrate-binding protein